MATPQYDRLNTRRINLKLNKKTDADVIQYLESKNNIQGFLKELIRKQMNEERKPKPGRMPGTPSKEESEFNATLNLMREIVK